jgi:hypothetical protein
MSPVLNIFWLVVQIVVGYQDAVKQRIAYAVDWIKIGDQRIKAFK